jgi:hypothetical protein
MEALQVPRLRFTEATRPADEIDYFEKGGMTDAELEQYARRTTTRPLLCFAMIAAAPFIIEGLCRLFGAW